MYSQRFSYTYIYIYAYMYIYCLSLSPPYTYIYINFHILFPYWLFKNLPYSSLCCTVGPCWLSISCIVVCISVNPDFLVYPHPTFSLGKPLTCFSVCEVSVLQISALSLFFRFIVCYFSLSD